MVSFPNLLVPSLCCPVVCSAKASLELPLKLDTALLYNLTLVERSFSLTFFFNNSKF